MIARGLYTLALRLPALSFVGLSPAMADETFEPNTVNSAPRSFVLGPNKVYYLLMSLLIALPFVILSLM